MTTRRNVLVPLSTALLATLGTVPRSLRSSFPLPPADHSSESPREAWRRVARPRALRASRGRGLGDRRVARRELPEEPRCPEQREDVRDRAR